MLFSASPQKHKTINFLLAGVLLLAGLATSGLENPGTGRSPSSTQFSARLAALPPVILWAWERPEDLRSLAEKQFGVAFLAETVTLSGAEVRVRPRLQTLRVSPGTPLVACARIESEAKRPPTLSRDQLATATAAIARLGAWPGILAVQVDFDATTSERAFYAQLLGGLRRALPPTMPLSITALASWCASDPWIQDLPVDEAVPMLFRMGPDAEDIRLRLEEGRDFALDVCRESVGVSTDEPISNLPKRRRKYIFNATGWSNETLKALGAELKP
jgi:uncharacterized protein DUF3142